MDTDNSSTASRIESERWQMLHRLEGWLERPMVLLAFVWLALFAVEVIWGLSPILWMTSQIIWVLFIVDFLVRLTVAPRKLAFLRSNWLTALSLMAPALRALRVVRVLRLGRVAASARGLRLLRALSSVNRGMRALGASMSRRGLGYVLALTLIVLVAGSAAMYGFEYRPEGKGLKSYGEALWWTAMILTTSGSEYWPQTPAGRLLCFLLALYAFAVFGYVTAALATFFVGRDADSDDAEVAGARQIESLRKEIAALRQDLANGGRDERSKEDGGASPGTPS